MSCVSLSLSPSQLWCSPPCLAAMAALVAMAVPAAWAVAQAWVEAAATPMAAATALEVASVPAVAEAWGVASAPLEAAVPPSNTPPRPPPAGRATSTESCYQILVPCCPRLQQHCPFSGYFSSPASNFPRPLNYSWSGPILISTVYTCCTWAPIIHHQKVKNH